MSLTTSFPNLALANYRITSQADSSYNCIAWAAGVSDAWWWPDDSSYWPDSVAKSATIDSFTSAYQTLGYTVCDDHLYQDGIEKIAIYAIDGLPTHVARQLSNSFWTSKLGRDVDIEHPLEGLEGNIYGQVVQVMSRRFDSLPP